MKLFENRKPCPWCGGTSVWVCGDEWEDYRAYCTRKVDGKRCDAAGPSVRPKNGLRTGAPGESEALDEALFLDAPDAWDGPRRPIARRRRRWAGLP